MTDEATRTRKAYFRVGASRPLEPGAFARVRLTSVAGAAQHPGATASVFVSDESLVRRGELTGVFVLRDGHAWLRWLHIGSERGGRTEVLAGLDAGEEIALRPAALQDGQPIRVAP